MAEILKLDDAALKSVLDADKPVMLVLSDGSDLRGDFLSTLKKTAEKRNDIAFVRVDPTENTEAAAQFRMGKKSLLIGWYRGNEVVRRSRPWGTDVPLALEMLDKAISEAPDEADNIADTIIEQQEEQTLVDNAPVNVTDETFQQEAIDYSDTMPVLIDFWAEWCGPCRAVAPVLEKLATEYAGKIRVAKVDVDANPGLAQYFQIMSIPTIMILKNRTQIFSQPGAFPEAAFRDLIEQAINLEVPEQEAQPEGPES